MQFSYLMRLLMLSPHFSVALFLSFVSHSTSSPLPAAFTAAQRSCCSSSVLSHHISHWSLPVSSCVLCCCQWGASHRGNWPCSWTQQPSSHHRLLLVAGFGDFHLSHINHSRGSQSPDHKAKCITCAQWAVFPMSCHPKALQRGYACAQQVRKCLLAMLMMGSVCCLSA